MTHTDEKAARLLDAWAAAVGGRESLEWTGTARIQGRLHCRNANASEYCCSLEMWISSNGSFREETSLPGNEHSVKVFNAHDIKASHLLPDDTLSSVLYGHRHSGRTGAARGRPRTLSSPSSAEQIITQAYLVGACALVPDRLPGTVRYLGEDDAGRPRLAVSPEGGVPVVVSIDPSTSLPAFIEQEDKSPFCLSKWTEIGDVRVPLHVSWQSSGSGVSYDFELTELAISGAADDGLFDEPGPEAPAVVKFSSGGTAPDIPFRLNNRNIFLEVFVSGGGPFWFALDTGTSMSIVDRELAASLGLNLLCSFEKSVGGGSQPTRFTLTEGVCLTLPGLEFRNHTMLAVDLSPIAHRDEGMPVGGILGGTFLSNFVTDIDFARRRVTLSGLNSAPCWHAGVEIPVTIESGVPYMPAALASGGESMSGTFMVDTGTQGALVLTAPAVRRNRFLERLEALRTEVFGIGGAAAIGVGRLPSLSIGSVELDDVIVELSRTTDGSLGSDKFDGFVGADILRRFDIRLDYSRKVMGLHPNRDLHDTFRWDMSGLVLVSEGSHFNRFEVAFVVDDSPASAAGIEKGDHLCSVDGEAVADTTLPRLEHRFIEPGVTVELGLERAGTPYSTVLTTRRMV